MARFLLSTAAHAPILPVYAVGSLADGEPVAAGVFTGGGELVALEQLVPVGVGFEHHAADADLVEQLALREREVVVSAALEPETDEVVGQHRVRVAVTVDGVGRPLLRAGRRPLEQVDGAGVDVEVVRIADALLNQDPMRVAVRLLPIDQLSSGMCGSMLSP